MFSYLLTKKTLLVCFTSLTFICCPLLVWSQGLQQTPYSAADSVRRGLSGPPDISPSNPLSLPRGSSGSDSIPISSGLFQGLLPNIPNLQLGYIYNFGQNVRAGRASVDYLLPVNLGNDSTIYGEAHGEFQSFWKTTPGSSNNRTDLSLGGGYRRMLGSRALVGLNGFFDTSKLYGNWYSSGSAGVEMAAEIAGNDAIDLNFNWYGRLFNSAVLSNAFRYGPSNYDFQVGYSHELYNGGPDLRLSATGYKFQAGSNVYGYDVGAEIKSRDGMFVLKSDVGQDRINRTYYTVGGYVNMGLQLEKLLSFESPFTMPEPIFKSPRNLRRLLTKTADRNWYQPTTVVVNRNYTPTTTTPTPNPPTPDPPTFTFALTGNDGASGEFDQQDGIPLTALTWEYVPVQNFSAVSYGFSVIVNDPNHVLPATIDILITITQGDYTVLGGSIFILNSLGPYIIHGAKTDGTPNNVTWLPGVYFALTASVFKTPPASGATGLLTITAIPPAPSVTPLTVTVTAFPS